MGRCGCLPACLLAKQGLVCVVLGRCLSSFFFLSSPALQVRVEQVLMSGPPPLLSFRLAQLLAFYLYTVETLLGPTSQLAGARCARWGSAAAGQPFLRSALAPSHLHPPTYLPTHWIHA